MGQDFLDMQYHEWGSDMEKQVNVKVFFIIIIFLNRVCNHCWKSTREVNILNKWIVQLSNWKIKREKYGQISGSV